MRRLTRGVQIGRLRIFWFRNIWRNKPRPYWFFRNWDTTVTVQSGPFEMFYRKKAFHQSGLESGVDF